METIVSTRDSVPDEDGCISYDVYNEDGSTSVETDSVKNAAPQPKGTIFVFLGEEITEAQANGLEPLPDPVPAAQAEGAHPPNEGYIH